MFYTIQLRSSNKKSLKKYANLFEKFLLLNKQTIKLVSLKQLPKSFICEVRSESAFRRLGSSWSGKTQDGATP